MQSKLLLDENPLLVMPQLAVKVGLAESMVLQQIHYWNKHNEKTGNNFKSGYYWTFNSYEQWQEQFPFWSISTIKRTISNLEKMGLVISSNFNKMKIDRTKWYRIDYKVLQTLENSPLCQNEPMVGSKWYDERVKMNRAIPETSPESSPKTNGYIAEGDDYLQTYRKAFKDTFGFEHREMRGTYKAIYEYDLQTLYDFLIEYMEDEPDPDKCTIDYFERIQGRFL